MQIDSFISDFEIIRELLHLIMKYGTLTPNSIAEMNISRSKYNKMKLLLLPVLGDTIEDRRYLDDTKQSLHITADQFSEGFSCLCNVYLVKSVKSPELVYRLIILQLLKQMSDLSQKQLLDRIADLNGFSESINEGTFSNYLKHLEAYGQICKADQIKPYKWSLKNHFLDRLSDNQLRDLLSFCDFMRHLQEPGVSGEQFYRSISEYIGSEETTSCFIIKNLRIGYVFDDEVLYQILKAIDESRLISFDYINQKRVKQHYTDILPVKIVSMDNIGRRYLFAVNLFCPEHYPTLFLLDNISYVESGEISDQYTTIEKEQLYCKSIHFSAGSLHINADSLTQIHLILQTEHINMLLHQLPDAEIGSENDGVCHAFVDVAHPRELRPFLRKNAEWIRLAPDDTSGLLEELNREADQWRALYGIIP